MKRLALVPAFVAAWGCSSPEPMMMAPRSLTETLDLYGVRREEIPSGDGRLIVVTAWGARVMGVMLEGENALWATPDLPGKDWNKGGWRTWYAPEGHAKGAFWDTGFANWTCPPDVDNGHYATAKSAKPGTRAYESPCRVQTNDGTAYTLRFRREIGALANPLVEDPLWGGMKGRVKYAGVAFSHAMKNEGEKVIDKEAGLWSLIQVKGPGTAIVPVTGGEAKGAFRDYYEPIPSDRWALQGGALTYLLDGTQRYKIGVPADRALGKIGWLAKFPSGAGLLLVKRFAVDPNGVYIDRPKSDATSNGDPIQSYNHLSGGPGGFSELECHAPAARLAPGEEQSFPIDLMIYRGDPADLKKIASKLLGVDVEKVRIF